MSAQCKDSASYGLDERAMAPGYEGRGGGSWGPSAASFPAVPPAAVPAGCNAEAWAQWRLLGAIERMVAQGFCYCHHHAPWWLPPATARASQDGVCTADCVGLRAKPYQGADCSNYSSYLFNLAFGLRFTSAIGAQACEPGRAPGRVLPHTVREQHLFRPGDLLFITPGFSEARTAGASAIRVSHVVVWTGHTADFSTAGGRFSWDTLLANTKPSQRAGVQKYADERRVAGLPVYVISDSHWTGPNYRPFAGWYVTSFSHARRVINPDPALPADIAGVASYSGGDCMTALCCS